MKKRIALGMKAKTNRFRNENKKIIPLEMKATGYRWKKKNSSAAELR